MYVCIRYKNAVSGEKFNFPKKLNPVDYNSEVQAIT